MRRSFLCSDNRIYICVHFELFMHSLFLEKTIEDGGIIDASSKRKKGIYQRQLNQTTIYALCKELSDYTGKTMYFDMLYINEANENTITVLQEMICQLSSKNKIVFFNTTEEIDRKITAIIRSLDKRVGDVSVLREMNELEWDALIGKQVELVISECSVEYNGPSPSSKVILSKFINVKKVIEEWDVFCFFVYRLALKMCKRGLFSIECPESNMDKSLLTHTVNGSIIGTVLCQLFGISMRNLDHLGPQIEMFDEIEIRKYDPNMVYYTVSDVICMGREVSDAKTFLKAKGVKCAGNITLVNIVPVGEASEDITYLVNIDKNNNFIKYSISADL